VKRVLFLAYHFPPIGGAGVQRAAKFARYLGDSGWTTVVVTGPGASASRWTPSDPSLLGELGVHTRVWRLTGPEPSASRPWRRRAERWLRLESRWARWWIDGLMTVGSQLGPGVDVIYAAMSPYETAEAAARLARRLHKPWVADLRDPWALDEMMVFPTRLHLRLELGRMRTVLRSASAIVMNTPEAAARLRSRFPELEGRPIASIPNGFDASDFSRPVVDRQDSRFRLVHTGYLHTELGRRHRHTSLARRLLGGSNGRVNILTRSLVYLVQAIQRLAATDPDLASRIELHLAGVLSRADREAVAPLPLVRLLGYLPHAETIDLIRSADLLFLPMHEVEPGQRVSIVPGKTYEYIASGRPILAAVPDGDARDLLVRSGTAAVCHPSDVEGMAHALRESIRRSLTGHPTRASDPAVLARFERRRLSRELACVFDMADLASRRPPRARPDLELLTRPRARPGSWR
jgi:glycosyltransferase involved in cell wall biosynthesis